MRPLKIEIGSSGVHPGVSARAGEQVRLRKVHSGEARQSVGACGAIAQRCALFG
jgi:hypothetical protein